MIKKTTATSEPLARTGRYMPGIDGLRALAVLAVIAYHFNLDWAPGGFLGVGVFFVLSGYLITDQIIHKWKRSKRLALKDFWLRRARRLLPAMLTMLLLVLAWLLLVDKSRLLSLKGEVLSTVFYTNNWWLIFHDVSYFESFGPSSPLGHLWSLAIEEQFYLIWPLALALGLRFFPQRGKLLLLTLTGAALSAFAMSLLFQPGADPSRVYYGTDTRSFALLIGAALAIVWPSQRLTSQISSKTRLMLDSTGGFGLVLILLMMGQMSEYESFVYRGGLVLLSVLTAIVVAVLAHPASRLGKLMGCKPLRWIGVRSYGIYLWHYPVIVLTSPVVDTGDIDVLRVVLQIGASLVLAALSWKFIEEPILHGALGKLWARVRTGSLELKKRRILFVSIGLVFLVCVSFYGSLKQSSYLLAADPIVQLAGNGSVNSQHPLIQEETSDEATGEVPKGASEGVPKGIAKESSRGIAKEASKEVPKGIAEETTEGDSNEVPKETPKETTGEAEVDASAEASEEASTDGTDVAVEDTPEDATEATQQETQPGSDSGTAEKEEPLQKPGASNTDSGKGVTAIGDSVILDAAPFLEKLLPGIVIDGKVGRQMSQAQEVVDQLKSEGKLKSHVIIELGTNGAFTAKQLGKLLDSLSEVQQVILVNTRVPRKWQDTVNSTLKKVAADFPNAAILDWYSFSEGKEDFFSKDGVHLKSEGAEFYASLLTEAVQD
ncbi:acyltransferase family protein [Paenibacillus eucommiae]|uniref:acyltransferase family protein n=1 Tax=Paenibacillus eucommiae TaxID=1355755 RepID=UPI0035E43D02